MPHACRVGSRETLAHHAAEGWQADPCELAAQQIASITTPVTKAKPRQKKTAA